MIVQSFWTVMDLNYEIRQKLNITVPSFGLKRYIVESLWKINLHILSLK